MSVDLNKNNIQINYLVNEKSAEYAHENDLIVPDNKPDVYSILQVDADTAITEKQVKKGMVYINCRVSYKIIYIADETNDIKSIINNDEFSYTVDISEAVPEMKCNVFIDLTKVEFSIINGRKIRLKSEFDINCKLYKSEVIEIVSDIAKSDNIEVLKNNIKMANNVIQDEIEFEVAEEFEVPYGKSSINEILKFDVKANNVEAKVMSNKILLKGEMNVCFLYTGDIGQNDLEFFEQAVPFSEIFEIEGIDESMECEYDCRVYNTNYRLKNDNEGDIRIIELENTLKFNYSINEELNLDTVADVFSTDNNLITEQDDFTYDQIVEIDNIELNTNQSFTIDQDLPNVQNIYNVINKPYINSTKIENGVLEIDGVVDTYVLYISNNETNPIYSCKFEIPFNTSINTSASNDNLKCDIKIEVEHSDYDYNENASSINFRQILKISYKLIETKNVKLIKNVEVSEEDEEEKPEELPSVIIYFVQDKETLWDIAKKYRISPSSIKAINELEDNEELEKGKQLIITK